VTKFKFQGNDFSQLCITLSAKMKMLLPIQTRILATNLFFWF